MAADIEAILVSYLTPLLAVRVVTELPPELTAPETLPIVQVEEVPGGIERAPGLDVCDVDIDAYAEGREAARLLAEHARQLVCAMAGVQFDDGQTVISHVRLTQKPVRLPYDNSAIRRLNGSYRITVHSRV